MSARTVNRFADELLPRDLLTKAIYAQMEKDRLPYVRMLLKGHVEGSISERFPGIHAHCLQEGYDLTEDYIPVVPAQHYFMGGIEVDLQSKTSLANLVRRRGNELQRRAWEEPPGEQFAVGKLGVQ